MTYLNPYVFLLLKKIIEIEITLEKGKRPSIEVISHEVVNNHFPNESKAKEGTRDKIRKLWSRKTFDFDNVQLDILSRFPEKLSKSFSWGHFCEAYNVGGFGRKGETFRNVAFERLGGMDQMHIQSIVSVQASELFLRYEMVTKDVSTSQFDNLEELHYAMYDIYLLPKFEEAYGLAPSEFNKVEDYLTKMEDFRRKLKEESSDWLNDKRA